MRRRHRSQTAHPAHTHLRPAAAPRTPVRPGGTRRIGGVWVTGFGGKITLDNTLQSRLMLAYETRLPQLMKVLFQ